MMRCVSGVSKAQLRRIHSELCWRQVVQLQIPTVPPPQRPPLGGPEDVDGRDRSYSSMRDGSRM